MAQPDRPHFREQLQRKWDEGKFVCVGLDADYSKLPPHLASRAKEYGATNLNLRQEVTYEFLIGIVNATADLVCAYKPNIAFFEDQRQSELALKGIVSYIHAAHPDVPVIGDVKRADIGNTNRGYARMAFDRYGFDAITTNPYLGPDTYGPFLRYKGKGLVVLGKTTNKEAAIYQDTPTTVEYYAHVQQANGTPLTEEEYRLALGAQESGAGQEYYKRTYGIELARTQLPMFFLVALRTATSAQENPNIGLVVGATHPESFDPLRHLAPDLPFLIPGIGSQGGDLEKTLQYAPDSRNQGMIINSSSGIIFASSGEDFADAARTKTLQLHNQIQELRKAK